MKKSDQETSRMADVMAFVLFHLEELVDAGLVKGPKLLTASGRAHVVGLKKSGFEPTHEEQITAIAYLQGGGLEPREKSSNDAK